MQNKLIEEYYNWFNSYVKDFYGEDCFVNQNIKLKEIHTLNVTKHAVNIAKSLNLTEEEVNTAEIIGLFHDIGRFEQFRIYKTFKDYTSINYIKEKNILNILINCLPKNEEINGISKYLEQYLEHFIMNYKIEGM